MPRQYEDIKRSEMASGKSEKEAERIAAMTYIREAGPPGSKARHRAAKNLQKD